MKYALRSVKRFSHFKGYLFVLWRMDENPKFNMNCHCFMCTWRTDSKNLVLKP